MNEIQCLIPYIKTLSGDRDTPITLYERFVKDSEGFLLESKDPTKGRFSFIGKSPKSVIKGYGNTLTIIDGDKEAKLIGQSLQLIKDYLSSYKVDNNSNLPFVGGAVGMVSYDIVKQQESLPSCNPDELEVPDIHLMIARELIVYDHFHSQVHIVVLEEDSTVGNDIATSKLDYMELKLNEQVKPLNQISYLQPFASSMAEKLDQYRDQFIEKVKRAKEYIKEGDIFQVVLSQRWCIETNKKSFDLYRQLREINPSPYLFYFNFGDYQLAGSSPEMLVEVRGDHVYTCPIAGTRRRGKTSEEDTILARDLLEDEKERSEHVMLVDLARNDMGRISKIGTVKVTDFMKVHNYSHVMHMVSTVEGIKNEHEDSFSILSHFLPAGTLSGAPKIRAMEIIEELEDVKRGPYGGVVGYFSFNGDLDTCIAIRTMIIKDGKVYLQAGAGIVADSIPENEYEECRNKIQSLVKAIECC